MIKKSHVWKRHFNPLLVGVVRCIKLTKHNKGQWPRAGTTPQKLRVAGRHTQVAIVYRSIEMPVCLRLSVMDRDQTDS